MANPVPPFWRLRHPFKYLWSVITYKGAYTRHGPWRRAYVGSLLVGAWWRSVKPRPEVAALERLAPGQRVEIRTIDPVAERKAAKRR